MATWDKQRVIDGIAAGKAGAFGDARQIQENMEAAFEASQNAPQIQGAELELISLTAYDSVGDPGYMEVVLPTDVYDTFVGLQIIHWFDAFSGSAFNYSVADLHNGGTLVTSYIAIDEFSMGAPGDFRLLSGFGLTWADDPFGGGYKVVKGQSGLPCARAAFDQSTPSNAAFSSGETFNGAVASAADRIRIQLGAAGGSTTSPAKFANVSDGEIYLYGVRRDALDNGGFVA